MEVKNITVLGAGAMGQGIAEVAATAGYKVVLRDIKEEFVQKGYKGIEKNFDKSIKKGKMDEAQKKAIMSLITPVVDLAQAVKNADLIIEAVPEIVKLKKEVFAEVEKHAPAGAVLATNTSSISITEIASVLKNPARFVGLHFFNPVPTMQLVEIIYGNKTSDDAAKVVEVVSKKMKKVPIYVRKDIPGFVVNRIFCPMANEQVWALDNGEIQSCMEADAAIKFKLGLPMGMFELNDFLGSVGVLCHVMNYFREALGESYRPAPTLAKLAKDGHLGRISKKGFYDWSNPENKNEITLAAGRKCDPIRFFAPAVNEAAKIMEVGAATKEDVDTGVLLGLGYPRGILRMADDIGLDVIVNELNRLNTKFNEQRYVPSAVLTDLVKKGKCGRKSEQGFYAYGKGKYEFVKFSVSKNIGTLVLNRPARANALNLSFLDEIACVLDTVEKDDNIRCLIITGAGRNFCGGADMSGFATGRPEDLMNFSNAGHEVFTKLETLSKLVIASINGPALGGGFELALACDFRVMNDKAFLQLPELNLGLFPGWGGTQRLTRMVGMSQAKQIIFLTEKIDAGKALELGIANFVVTPEELKEGFVEKLAEKLAAGAPLAQKLTKRVMYYGDQADQRTALYLENAAIGDVCPTDDISEGVTAVMNRRAPQFSGK